MKNRLIARFNFSKKEFNGLVLLLGMLLALMFFPYVFKWCFPVKDNPREDELALLELRARLEKQSFSRQTKEKLFFKKAKPGALFFFDPNAIGLEQWQQLGFSEKQALSILNYRSKGGRFKRAEDLQKMYVVSAGQYQRLYPYIKISSAPADSSPGQTKRGYTAPVKVWIELNAADSMELDRVRGIGPAFARRIVKYRDRLGGFYKKEQLLEVFGLDSAKFMEIRDQVWADSTAVKKLNINTAVMEDFKYHPYLRYKQANAIIEYRKQHGNYVNIADLKKVAILTPPLVEILSHYISF